MAGSRPLLMMWRVEPSPLHCVMQIQHTEGIITLTLARELSFVCNMHIR